MIKKSKVNIALAFVLCSGLLFGMQSPVSAASPELSDGAVAAGLFVNERTWSASVADYNLDGYEDVWVGFHQKVDSKLMRNNQNGTYTYVAPNLTKRINSQRGILDRHDCDWADVDKNGLPDMYCSGGRNLTNYVKTGEKDNEMWMQYTPGEFTDMGTAWGLGDPCGRGRFVQFLDLNNDGWQDLFVGNEQPRAVTGDPCDVVSNGYLPEYSKVFMNTGGTGFRYAPEWSTPNPSAGINCAIALDYNKDGWMDLLACNYKTSRPQLYRNNAGTGFTEVSNDVGIKLTAMTDGVYEDVTGDNIPDLVASDRAGFFYRPGTATGFGTAVRVYTHGTTSNLYGWGVAVGDINGDGRNDIYGMIHDNSLATNPDDAVFINNGNATVNRPTFTRLTPPSATGNASSVITLHPTPGGPAKFFVQNGREDVAGPNQLIQYNF